MQINLFDVVVWIIEAWLLINVVKWGVKVLFGALGMEPRQLVKRLRRLKRLRARNKAAVRKSSEGSVYLIGSVEDARHQVVHAADESEARQLGAQALQANEGALIVTEVYDRVLSR